MAQRDYYEVLGLSRDSNERDIKKAYRAKAMEFHPDRNPGTEAEEKFKEASEAYEVLSDAQKKQIYDSYGHAGLKNQGFSGFSGVGVEDIFSSFGDIFGDLFGFGGGRARRGGISRGADLRYDMNITFEEAILGCEQEIEVQQLQICGSCAGHGAEPGSQPIHCPGCNGHGQVAHGQGLFVISTTCPQCHGGGQIQQKPCKTCDGEGRKPTLRSVTVKIPAGFADGMSLRYAGEGDPGMRGGPPGDLYVAVIVEPHPTLKRHNDDLIAEVTLSVSQAALGDKLDIELIEGEEQVSIPKGTQPGDIVTIKKRGVTRLRGGGKGDLHVVCKVEIPRHINGKQKELFEELAFVSGEGKAKTKKRGIFS